MTARACMVVDGNLDWFFIKFLKVSYYLLGSIIRFMFSQWFVFLYLEIWPTLGQLSE